MVQLDTRLPLMAQGPNVLAAMDAGTVAAGNTANLLRQAEGQNLFRQYGAGAMQGDQNALAQIAGFDPMMGQTMDINRQENRRADTRLGMDQERLQMLKAETARALAAAEDQAQAAAEAQQLDQIATAAIRAHAAGDQGAFAKLTAAAFGQPLPFTPEGLAALAATHEGAKTYMGALPKPQGPQSPAGKLAADLAAGLITPEQYEEASRPRGTSLTVGADGAISFNDGVMPSGTTGVLGVAKLQAGSGQVRMADPNSPTGTRVFAEPGSEAAAAESKRAETQRQSRIKMDNLLGVLDLNIKDIEDGGLPVTGYLGERRRSGAGRLLTGDGAVDFQNRTDQITDAAAFEEIQRMRDNSPTGGAVGQLTDPERRAIGNAVTGLNTATSEAEYLRAAYAYRRLALNLAFGDGKWSIDPSTNEIVIQGGQSELDDLSPDARAAFELYGAPQ
jgi:hypothetical protein